MAREEEALEQQEIPIAEKQAGQGAKFSGDSQGLATIPKVSDLLRSAEGAAPHAARAPKLPSTREIEDHELTIVLPIRR